VAERPGRRAGASVLHGGGAGAGGGVPGHDDACCRSGEPARWLFPADAPRSRRGRSGSVRWSVALALVVLLAPIVARAEDADGGVDGAATHTTATATTSTTTSTNTSTLASPPGDAGMALERARAAYEYGDMEMLVESARMVAEGKLRPTTAQRAQALRYLGIGLFVTNRPEGAETAFF